MNSTYTTPFADILPPLSTEERAALAADLEARGQLDPIYVDEEGNVLDGHNRLDLADDPWVETISGLGSREEKEAFVLSRNLKRRNLSPDQKEHVRKAMKATAKKLREQDPTTWTQEALAVAFGVDQATVSRWTYDDSLHNMQPHNVINRCGSAQQGSQARSSSGSDRQPQAVGDYGVTQPRFAVVKAGKRSRSGLL